MYLRRFSVRGVGGQPQTILKNSVIYRSIHQSAIVAVQNSSNDTKVAPLPRKIMPVFDPKRKWQSPTSGNNLNTRQSAPLKPENNSRPSNLNKKSGTESSSPRGEKQSSSPAVVASPNVKVVNPVIGALSKRLEAAHLAKNPYEIDETIKISREMSAKLTPSDLQIGFEGCVTVGNFQLCCWIIEEMHKIHLPDRSDYVKKFIRCFHRESHNLAVVEFIRRLITENYSVPNTVKIEYVFILLNHACNSTSMNLEAVTEAYNLFLHLAKDPKSSLSMPRPMFRSLATRFFYFGGTGLDQCLRMFQEMNQVSELDTHAFAYILDSAVVSNEMKIIRSLASQYLESFNAPLNIGMIRRIIAMATAAGDGPLAITAFQLLVKTGLPPDRIDYLNLVRALVKAKDIVGVVEALQDHEVRQVALIKSYAEAKATISPFLEVIPGQANAFAVHTSIKEEIKRIFLTPNYHSASSIVPDKKEDNKPSPSKQQSAVEDTVNRYTLLEDFYYALVDQAQHNQRVPRVVLDAVLEAFGSFSVPDERDRSLHIERVKSIFAEYPTTFKLEHDVSSHIAYIKAIREHSEFLDFLSSFQNFEAFLKAHPQRGTEEHDFISKEAYSVVYSHLFLSLLDRNDLRSFDDLWAHMLGDLKVTPSLSCMMALADELPRRSQGWSAVMAAMNNKFRSSHDLKRHSFGDSRNPHIPKDVLMKLGAYTPGYTGVPKSAAEKAEAAASRQAKASLSPDGTAAKKRTWKKKKDKKDKKSTSAVQEKSPNSAAVTASP